jgi:hypothetical protein
MSNGDRLPKCQQPCEFPEGITPYYNCPGPKTYVVGATDITGLPDGLTGEVVERIGKPVDVRVCGNAAIRGIDPEAANFMAKSIDSVEDSLKDCP